MKKESTTSEDMLAEYDFSKGIKGKYAGKYAWGTNIVLLDPDVAEVFRDSQSVKEALRGLIKLSKQTAGQKPVS